MKANIDFKIPLFSFDFVGMLQVAFIVLKIIDKVEWSWVWVMAPMWIGVSIGLIALVIALIVLLLLGRTG